MKSDLHDKIEMLRSERQSESAFRRKKVSKILIIGNVLILLVMMFYARKPLQVKYSTSVIEYNHINYRLSAVKSVETGKILLSLALKSKSAKNHRENFIKHIVSILVRYNERVLYNTRFGNDTSVLDFAPYEVKSYRVAIDNSLFREFASVNPESIVPQKKSYLFGEQQYIHFTIGIHINTPKSIYSEMDFYYQID